MLRRKLAAGASLAALAFTSVTPAYAAGTTAGSSIVNNATVDYKVGGISQNQLSASNSFVVDRKVNLVVAEVGNSTTTVSPGQTSAVTTFTVTNSSNATLDFGLAATNRSGGAAAHGGTDNFDVSNIKMYVDTNSNGTYDAGTDQQVTYLDQVAADAVVTVFVVADVPLGRATGDVAGVRLTATAADGSTAGSQGATLTQTAGANTAAMDTVFADTNANGNTASDGISFAEDDYTVSAANVSVVKTSRVISDPINGATNPKMIPNAVVEYCIAVANGSGSATATNVAITDPVPAQTTYDSTFGIKLNGTVTAGNCNADGAAGGTFASNTVSGTIASLIAGDTRTLVFRVTIN
jgi:uncharacterized repeat protein (TIGR01451 family)